MLKIRGIFKCSNCGKIIYQLSLIFTQNMNDRISLFVILASTNAAQKVRIKFLTENKSL